jgi:hypothetical protein
MSKAIVGDPAYDIEIVQKCKEMDALIGLKGGLQLDGYTINQLRATAYHMQLLAKKWAPVREAQSKGGIKGAAIKKEQKEEKDGV